MQIHLNGQIEETPDDLTLAELVAARGWLPIRVAVEINEQLIPRKNYESTVLKEGDQIEVVTFVGGG